MPARSFALVGGPSGPMLFAPIAGILDKSIGLEGPPTKAPWLRSAQRFTLRTAASNAAVFRSQGFVSCQATPSPCIAPSGPSNCSACARTRSSAGRRACRSSRSSIRSPTSATPPRSPNAGTSRTAASAR
ncbi:DUF6053 domain-containing protein [Lysobacter enzymogenes]|uniref:DUF6053 domain-containing protein n=1 Tax=Lysobacter enzymogenes TaxID=69 RepID=UPI003397BF07